MLILRQSSYGFFQSSTTPSLASANSCESIRNTKLQIFH